MWKFTMKNIVALFVLVLMSASSFAEQGWVGRGGATTGSNPRAASVQWVQQDASGWVKFKINESSLSLPADRVYKFDGNSTTGKNTLAILLTAQSSDAPISFYEIENFAGENFWKVDNLTVGKI